MTWFSRSRHSLTLYISQTVRHIHKCHWNTRDLHTPYPTVSFQMTLSDLAKYSMTWSVAQSLCDSWGSCHGSWACIVQTGEVRLAGFDVCLIELDSYCNRTAVYPTYPPIRQLNSTSLTTRSSAVAERPRDASCRWISHSRLLKDIRNDTVEYGMCNSLLVFHSNSGRIYSRFDTIHERDRRETDTALPHRPRLYG